MHNSTFVPGSITAFFAVQDGPSFRGKGSVGASICLSDGVSTTVHARSASHTSFSHRTNGVECSLPVGDHVCQRLLAHLCGPLNVSVTHDTSLPIGAGYGVSGATALGTARCLTPLCNDPPDPLTVALDAEVRTGGGYGDVIAQHEGGVCIRTRPCSTTGIIPIDAHGLNVVSVSFGPLDTGAVLSDDALIRRISSVGSQSLAALTDSPSVECLMSCASHFTRRTGMATERVNKAIRAIDHTHDLPGAMVMLGDGAFTLSDEEGLEPLIEELRPLGGALLVSRIAEVVPCQ
ncbi:MAG TPA: hypothetical protein ENN11_01645 [Methanomicrobia archaeon]|nr:hypothetical protein [Methanomicrobia archaeon]